MPNMHGAAVQCCMCVVGVFLFLGGLIMLVTGICVILNYGLFDENLLPPDLQNDEGKKTVGIILTSCGLFAILISVVASLMYLCTKPKHSTINPRDLSRIPNSARNTPPERPDNRRRSGPVKPITANGLVRGQPNAKSIPGSTEVIPPRQVGHGHRKRGNRKMKHRGRRLEEIKEQDAISRKTIEGGALAEDEMNYNMTPRSGSFSSQYTLTEAPRIVVAPEESMRCPSADSASISQASDISNFRGGPEYDKSRRELQFMTDSSIRYTNAPYDSVSKDSMSLDKYGESIVNRRDSEEGSIVSERYTGSVDNKHQMSTSSFNSFNEKISAGGNDFTAQGRLPDVSSSDEGSSLVEFRRMKASGRMEELGMRSDYEIQTIRDGRGAQGQSASQTALDSVESTCNTPDVIPVTSHTQDNDSQRHNSNSDSFA